MGIFGRSTSPDSAAPKRRQNARVVPISEPSTSTRPVAPPTPTDEQEAQYSRLLEYMRSSEHGLTFTEAEQMYLSREQLLRFCRATKWDYSKTKARLLATLKWRRDYGVYKITADHIEPEATTGKQVILGFDNSQRPCLYLFPGRQNTTVSPRQVQYLVWGLERVIELMPPGVENIALLVNYKGSTGEKNPGIGQGREVLNILQTHYVETLGRALVINIPFFVWGFFKLITPFIDPLTREKLKFNEDMTQHVPKSQLDSEFGGDVVFDYVQEDYWPALLSLCEQARSRRLRNWKEAGGGIGVSEDIMKRHSTGHKSSEIQETVAPYTSTAQASNFSNGASFQDQSLGTRLVHQADASALSQEPVEAVYVPGTAHGPQVLQKGQGLE